MIYIGEFRNINDELIQISIVTKNDTTTRTDLKLANNPLVISSISNYIFEPIKSESATISILTTEIYKDIYSNKVNETTVTATNLTKNKVLFKGYVTPNIYSQEYNDLDLLEIEAVSALSGLKNIKFKYTTDIISWYDLISEALSKVGYTSFYMTNSYRLTKESNDNILKHLHQYSNNFIDDDDEKTPWKYYDILSEFCTYFCLSLVSYNGEVYFVDYKNTSSYTKYDFVNKTESVVNFNYKYTITEDSHTSNENKISYDETFNKIEVSVNLYENHYVFDDPMEDLVNQNKDPNKIYEHQETIDKEDYTILNAYLDSKKWETNHIGEITLENSKDLTTASFFQKVDHYLTEEEPSSLKWSTYLTAYNDGIGFNKGLEFLITKPKEEKYFIANGGYFIVNLDYKFSKYANANDCYKTSDQTYADGKHNNGLEDTLFPCRLWIGNYFYDGENWVSDRVFNRKKAKGYYKQFIYVVTQKPIPTWYKYKDADGDWVFTNNKAEWDQATTEKESGKSSDPNRVYYYISDTNEKVYIDQDYYYECKLQDRFYLVRKNKKGEPIFDTAKSLTNTVSWRFNIVDSEDGVAIKLPNFILSGMLKFEVYTPNYLGEFGQFSSAPHESGQEKVHAVHINNLELAYKATIGTDYDIFQKQTDQEDVVYTNIIDEDYVNEWDSLTLKVNTQVEDRVTSMSSILYRKPDLSYVFLDKVYDNEYKNYRIQEENLIERIYNHFCTPKIILDTELKGDIHPLSLVRENNLQKDLSVNSYTYVVKDDEVIINLIEL